MAKQVHGSLSRSIQSFDKHPEMAGSMSRDQILGMAVDG